MNDPLPPNQDYHVYTFDPPAAPVRWPWLVVAVLMCVAIFAILVDGGGPSMPAKSYCEQSWESYVDNGRPNNVGHNKYVADCETVRDAVAEATR